jgi:hypothetical protein
LSAACKGSVCNLTSIWESVLVGPSEALMALPARAGVAANYASEDTRSPPGFATGILGLGNHAGHPVTGAWFPFTAIKRRRILGALLQKKGIWRCVQTHLNFLTSSIRMTRSCRGFIRLVEARSSADPLNEHISVSRRTNPYWEIGSFDREETMKRTKCLLAIVGIVCGLMTPAQMASADGNETPLVVPPQSESFPQTYGEWGGRWSQYTIGIPAGENPIADQSGALCHLGQWGPVFFLVGTGGGSATRSCDVPADTGIFFPDRGDLVDRGPGDGVRARGRS